MMELGAYVYEEDSGVKEGPKVLKILMMEQERVSGLQCVG